MHEIRQTKYFSGPWGSVVVKVLRYWSEGPRIDLRSCHLGFFPKPGFDSASKNEYQDIPGGKGGRCDDLTTFMCRVSRNLGALTSWTPLKFKIKINVFQSSVDSGNQHSLPAAPDCPFCTLAGSLFIRKLVINFTDQLQLHLIPKHKI